MREVLSYSRRGGRFTPSSRSRGTHTISTGWCRTTPLTTRRSAGGGLRTFGADDRGDRLRGGRGHRGAGGPASGVRHRGAGGVATRGGAHARSAGRGGGGERPAALLDAVWCLRDLFGPGEVEELWTFFPDPWPKKRHHKRRLVTPEFAALAASRLRPGGVWRLATDWVEYADQMRTCSTPSRCWRAGAVERWADRPVTKFERKGLAVGQGHHRSRLPTDMTGLPPVSQYPTPPPPHHAPDHPQATTILIMGILGLAPVPGAGTVRVVDGQQGAARDRRVERSARRTGHGERRPHPGDGRHDHPGHRGRLLRRLRRGRDLLGVGLRRLLGLAWPARTTRLAAARARRATAPPRGRAPRAGPPAWSEHRAPRRRPPAPRRTPPGCPAAGPASSPPAGRGPLDGAGAGSRRAPPAAVRPAARPGAATRPTRLPSAMARWSRPRACRKRLTSARGSRASPMICARPSRTTPSMHLKSRPGCPTGQEQAGGNATQSGSGRRRGRSARLPRLGG